MMASHNMANKMPSHKVTAIAKVKEVGLSKRTTDDLTPNARTGIIFSCVFILVLLVVCVWWYYGYRNREAWTKGHKRLSSGNTSLLPHSRSRSPQRGRQHGRRGSNSAAVGMDEVLVGSVQYERSRRPYARASQGQAKDIEATAGDSNQQARPSCSQRRGTSSGGRNLPVSSPQSKRDSRKPMKVQHSVSAQTSSSSLDNDGQSSGSTLHPRVLHHAWGAADDRTRRSSSRGRRCDGGNHSSKMRSASRERRDKASLRSRDRTKEVAQWAEQHAASNKRENPAVDPVQRPRTPSSKSQPASKPETTPSHRREHHRSFSSSPPSIKSPGRSRHRKTSSGSTFIFERGTVNIGTLNLGARSAEPEAETNKSESSDDCVHDIMPKSKRQRRHSDAGGSKGRGSGGEFDATMSGALQM